MRVLSPDACGATRETPTHPRMRRVSWGQSAQTTTRDAGLCNIANEHPLAPLYIYIYIIYIYIYIYYIYIYIYIYIYNIYILYIYAHTYIYIHIHIQSIQKRLTFVVMYLCILNIERAKNLGGIFM